MSDQIWFQRVIGDRHGLGGFWMCPTPNCDGVGFSFDIFPTDPDHPVNAGWIDDDEFDDETLDLPDADAEYDPAERKWKDLDRFHGDFDGEEIEEGDEWKLGISPAERPSFFAQSDAGREIEDEPEDYNGPDRRPRELDWSNRPNDGPSSDFNDDDIPF